MKENGLAIFLKNFETHARCLTSTPLFEVVTAASTWYHNIKTKTVFCFIDGSENSHQYYLYSTNFMFFKQRTREHYGWELLSKVDDSPSHAQNQSLKTSPKFFEVPLSVRFSASPLLWLHNLTATHITRERTPARILIKGSFESQEVNAFMGDFKPAKTFYLTKKCSSFTWCGAPPSGV